MLFWILWLIVLHSQFKNGKGDMDAGRCGEVKAMSPFNVTNIMGKWYLYEVNEVLSSIARRCSTYTFQGTPGSPTINLTVSNQLLNTYNVVDCTLEQIGQTSKFTEVGLYRLSTPLYIIDTDYKGYLIIYTCMDIFNIASDRNVLVLTRKRKPNTSVIDKAEAVLENRQLGDPEEYYKIPQDKCVN